ncbi:hypothetical protein IFM47457_02286 [Aspergillus lentulus]|nr:hypothetical protein IFM47457_02286 [Aspergillus lentulus]
MYDRREVDWKEARRQRDIVRSAVSRIVASEIKRRFEDQGSGEIEAFGHQVINRGDSLAEVGKVRNDTAPVKDGPVTGMLRQRRAEYRPNRR